MINEIYEELIREDWKRAVGSAVVSAGLALGGTGLAKSTPPASPQKATRPATKAPAKETKPTDPNTIDIKKMFGNEYSTIEKAAKRNGIDPNSQDFAILLAIRKSENGPKGKEFGILHPKAINTNLDTQAGWAAATIKKNRERWTEAGKKEDFITFLGKRYAPQGVKNDPKNLNKNWIKNVTMWTKKFERSL